jgi:CRP-like cAMP-binding protein
MPYRANLLLASLPSQDRSLLEPHLKTVELRQAHILYESGDTITTAYFPYDAVISLVATLTTGEMIEAAMVGRDGVVGAAAALDGRITLSRAIVQLGGTGAACAVDDLHQAAMASPVLLALLIRHEQTVFGQAQQSAACNITHALEARLARWMLRARHLSSSDTLPFTQEFLAEMLGVRRTSVSLVAHTLQQAGMIQYKRGRIQITDLEALRETACECHATVQRHYELLLGHKGSNTA